VQALKSGKRFWPQGIKCNSIVKCRNVMAWLMVGV
jgi:hypothetical protein